MHFIYYANISRVRILHIEVSVLFLCCFGLKPKEEEPISENILDGIHRILTPHSLEKDLARTNSSGTKSVI